MSLNLSEDQNSLIRAKEAIDLERENLRTDARTLANLRSEHARLKDDFRSLFTSNERIKSDYCSLQTDYKVRLWSLPQPISASPSIPTATSNTQYIQYTY